MKQLFAELKCTLSADHNGLRLSSAVLGLLVGLTLVINARIFEATPSYTALRPYPEWFFGAIFWTISVLLMIGKRGLVRFSSLLLSATQWLFWSAFIYISTETINTGSACYLGVSLLTFYEFYREVRGRRSL